ncbi:MAG: hypothetical protein ACXAB4_10250 [Candidatus Hodarchaeales archaeon]|jgi:hypothetical protein
MKIFADIVKTIIGDKDTETQSLVLNILKYLDQVNWPLTATTIAHKFHYTLEEVLQLLERLSENDVGFLQQRSVVDGTDRQTYYAFTFPETFDNACSQCCWYAEDHCTIWKTLSEQTPSRLPETLSARGSALHPASIACPAYQSADPTILYTIANWSDLSSKTLEANPNTISNNVVDCLLCGAPILSLFERTSDGWCPGCGAEYYLEYEDTGELVIIIIPDFDWLFSEKVAQITQFAEQPWAVTLG